MIYVVLGMHKSGTTLLARTLHESGIVMGQEFPAGVDYLRLKYEARWVQEINDEILSADRSVYSLKVTSGLLPKSGIDQTTRDKMEMGIREANQRFKQWGFKDPRTVLTYPFWKEVLPDHRLIIVYRDPVEVWKRYFNRHRPWQFRLPFDTWCDYNNLILDYARYSEEGEAICLSFEKLLSGRSEWDRLKQFVNTELIDVCDKSVSVNRLSKKDRNSFAYKLMSKLAGQNVSRILHKFDVLCLQEK